MTIKGNPKDAERLLRWLNGEAIDDVLDWDRRRPTTTAEVDAAFYTYLALQRLNIETQRDHEEEDRGDYR